MSENSFASLPLSILILSIAPFLSAEGNFYRVVIHKHGVFQQEEAIAILYEPHTGCLYRFCLAFGDVPILTIELDRDNHYVRNEIE